MAGPRYSIIPAAALEDENVTDTHLRILCLLARHSDNNGWLIINQKTLAASARMARETVNRKIAELVTLGYIRKHGRVGKSGQRLVNEYQIILDRPHPDETKENIPENDTPVIHQSHTPCDPPVTGYVTSEDHRVCDPLASQLNDPFLERPLSPKGDGRTQVRKPPSGSKWKGKEKEPKPKPQHITALDEVFDE